MKFKNKKEFIAFILMNLFGAPFTWIIIGIWLGWIGFISCIIIFYVLFKLWKYFGRHKEAKLTFSPSFNWAGKSYKV